MEMNAKASSAKASDPTDDCMVVGIKGGGHE